MAERPLARFHENDTPNLRLRPMPFSLYAVSPSANAHIAQEHVCDTRLAVHPNEKFNRVHGPAGAESCSQVREHLVTGRREFGKP